MIDTIIVIRNLFYRCFALGILFYLLTILIYHFEQQWSINIVSGFFKVNKQFISVIAVYFFGWMRMINVFSFLIPALALHWTGYSLKKGKK